MAGVLVEKRIAEGLLELYRAWKSGRLLPRPRRARPPERHDIMGRLDEELQGGDGGATAATVRVYDGEPGSESDTGQTIEVYGKLLVSGEDLPAETWVFVRSINHYFQIYAYQCDTS